VSTQSIKPQPTLTGYNAWAFRQLMAAKDVPPGPLAGWIIDRWIEENAKLLAEAYGIDRRDYQSSQNVVPIGRRSEHQMPD